MPTNENILALSHVVLNELDHFGYGAPFIAYVSVAPEDGTEHVFIIRGEDHPGTLPSSPSVEYVRYHLPLGRIAESEPGHMHEVRVAEYVGNRPTGHEFVKRYLILAKDVFFVEWVEGQSDARNNQIAYQNGSVFIPSLRLWIAFPPGDAAAEVARPRRRRIAERFELADIPVVDSAQGDAWRSDLRNFVIISGAPGTGKTTTLIKRIAQKIDAGSLVEGGEETTTPLAELRRWLHDGPTNWVLFTPSELLRGYLHEALAKEKLPATEERVPVWATAKVRIARDVLQFIGQNRLLSLGGDLVAAGESKTLTRWARGFLNHFSQKIHAELSQIVSEQAEALRETLKRIDDSCEKLRSEIGSLEAELNKLQSEAQNSEADQEEKRLRLKECKATQPSLEEVSKSWREIVAFAKQPHKTPLGRTLAELLSFSDRLQSFLKRYPEAAWPESERAAMQTIVAATRSMLGKFVSDSGDLVDPSIRKIPFTYHEYRLRASEGGTFYHPTAMGAVNDRKIDTCELDILIYVALATVRESLIGREIIQKHGNSITQRVINELRYVVAVDEATDFSAIELGCMRLLAHPVFDCITFAGDPMQRMTRHGIGDWNEAAELTELTPKIFNLNFSYRSGHKLLKIARALYENSMGETAPVSPGFSEDLNDPDALQFRAETYEKQICWVVARIGEIHRFSSQTLPSIAIFVPTETDVHQVADLLRKPLRETYGIETEACFEGLILGTQAKVRIFSVQFIKGLEFEAVFFMGVDHMVTFVPGLVDKFLYVGLTRSRRFLAITTFGDFPDELSHVARLFGQGTWEHLLPP